MTIARVAGLLAVMFLVSGCFWQEEDTSLQGYVEGDFLDVGAEETGRLLALDVQRGDSVSEQAMLFRIDDSDARAARSEAEARLEQARSQLADLKTGKREEEIDILEAQRAEIVASLQTARRDFQRYQTLHEASVVSDARTDSAQERFQVLESRLKAVEAEIEVARLTARPNAILAAEKAVDVAQATLTRVDARLGRLTGKAPMAGYIQDTYFEPGEVVPAGRPVVSLLPPDNLKVRIFVPETQLSQIALGDTVSVSCDGCEGAKPATVTFVSQTAEFTPPVIYSVHARQKLVYMVEARPEDVTGLKVGQPVDVRLMP